MNCQYIVNGGFCMTGAGAIVPGTAVELAFIDREMLIMNADRLAGIGFRYKMADLQQIALDGEDYKPRYVSFAKAPPQRDETVDRNATSRLTLRFGAQVLELEYRGAFSRHLAEVAAHTVYDLRKLSAADKVAGQPPKVFHVVR